MYASPRLKGLYHQLSIQVVNHQHQMMNEQFLSADKITSDVSSDDKSFILIIGIDKREEAVKNIDFQKSKEF